jgi:hypothetical protein
MGKNIWIASLALLSRTLIAEPDGHELGNGGDAVLCNGKYEVLDLFESRILPPYRELMTEVCSRDAIELAARFAAKVESLNADFGTYLRNGIQEFQDESQYRFVEDIDLVDIQDSGHVPLGDCRIVQVAVQSEPYHHLQPRYVINQDVWVQLSPMDQTALILHEVIYRYALERGQRNSVYVRRMVGLILSTEMGKQTSESFGILLEELFPTPVFPQFRVQEIVLFAEAENHTFADISGFMSLSAKPVKFWSLSGFNQSISIERTSGVIAINRTANQSVNGSLIASDSTGSVAIPLRIQIHPINDQPPHWIQPEFGLNFHRTSSAQPKDLLNYVADESLKTVKFSMESNEYMELNEEGLLRVLKWPDANINLPLTVIADDGSNQSAATINVGIAQDN